MHHRTAAVGAHRRQAAVGILAAASAAAAEGMLGVRRSLAAAASVGTLLVPAVGTLLAPAAVAGSLLVPEDIPLVPAAVAGTLPAPEPAVPGSPLVVPGGIPPVQELPADTQPEVPAGSQAQGGRSLRGQILGGQWGTQKGLA